MLPKKKNSSPVFTIFLFELFENIRNKWLILYAASFLVFSLCFYYLGTSDPLRVSASMMNLVLLIVPLFSLIFGGISFSESMSFHEILSTFPISRRDIFLGKWFGLVFGLSASFLTGMSIGSLFWSLFTGEDSSTYIVLLLTGVILTAVFVSISFCVVNFVKKKETTFGIMLILWFFLFVLYDLLVMWIVALFQDYPLSGLVFTLINLNPIDLARVILLLKINLASMMGYSAALFKKFLGGNLGLLIGFCALGFWIIIPLFIGIRVFKNKDL